MSERELAQQVSNLLAVVAELQGHVMALEGAANALLHKSDPAVRVNAAAALDRLQPRAAPNEHHLAAAQRSGFEKARKGLGV